MASAKAWYWMGLAVLALSVGSSNIGRCASAVADQLCARGMSYVAMAEMAFGHTQAGYGHMQAAMARVEAQRARIQAAQARKQAEWVRNELNPAQLVDMKKVLIDNQDFFTEQAHPVSVCPRTHVDLAMPEIHAASVNPEQDPI